MRIGAGSASPFGQTIQARGQEVAESCRKLGIDIQTATLFEWLEANDRASFNEPAHAAAK